jgi:hypothetical protein
MGREYLDIATKEENSTTWASSPSKPRLAKGFLLDSIPNHQHHLPPRNQRHKAREFQIGRGEMSRSEEEEILQIWRREPPEQPCATTTVRRNLAAHAAKMPECIRAHHSPPKPVASHRARPSPHSPEPPPREPWARSPAPTAKPVASHQREEPVEPPPWSRRARRGDPQPSHLMTHKYRGGIIVLSINKSVKPNKEQKVLTSTFDQGFTVNTSKQIFRGI